MNTKLYSIALTLFLVTTACVHAQQTSLPPATQSGANPAMPTAAQIALINKEGDLEQAARTALNKGHYADAEALARQAIAVPTDGFAHTVLAEALYYEGKDDEALPEYQYVVEHEDSQPRSLIPYAILELQAGDWAKAANAYNKSLGQTTDGPAKARSYFDPAVPQPDDLATALHIQMGQIDDPLFLSGDTFFCGKALNEYKQALAIEPNSPLAQLYYAHGLVAVGRKAEAKTLLQTISSSADGDIKADADNALKTL